jgi:hypothetical protein
MFSGSYNGWADMPEEEREALGVYEAREAAAEAAFAHRRITPALLVKTAIAFLARRASRQAA